MFVILLGAPGSGKGTQASLLAQQAGLAHIASGDLFREAVQRGTPLGRQAREYMERGELVPDRITVPLVMERLEAPDAVRGAILDGFPRTVEQARALDEALNDKGRRIERVLYLKVPREELLSRLSGRWICRACQATYHEVTYPPRRAGVCDRCGGELYQRADDRRETVERRLEVYFEQTLPLIDYYRGRSVLREINGNQPIPSVAEELLAAIRQDGG